MAKSTGNLVFVRDLLERWSAAAIRLLILERPFARPWDFDEARLDAASGELESLRSAEARPGGSPAASEEVARALRDNLDVPPRLAVAREARRGDDGRPREAPRTALRRQVVVAARPSPCDSGRE